MYFTMVKIIKALANIIVHSAIEMANILFNLIYFAIKQ
jgi:hypothetical protein